MMRYITSEELNPRKPSAELWRGSSSYGTRTDPGAVRTSRLKCWGGADEMSSHTNSQSPFAETRVRCTPIPCTLVRTRAPERFLPCNSSIGLGIPLHQLGGSVCWITGLVVDAECCRGFSSARVDRG